MDFVHVSIFHPFCVDLVNDEYKVYDHLFSKARYNKYMRPVWNSTEAVHVKFGIALIRLYHLVSSE